MILATYTPGNRRRLLKHKDRQRYQQEEDADPITYQVPLVIPNSRLAQPAAEGARVAGDRELLLAQLTCVIVDSGEPLLNTALMNKAN